MVLLQALSPDSFWPPVTHYPPPLIVQLMKVLSNKEFADIIAWTPSGKAFNILQPKLFTAKILPSHFKQAKYSSFTRKLHRWGFMRHYRGPEAGAFFHKHFRRGRMDLAEKMSCAKPGGSSPPSKPKKPVTVTNTTGMNMLLDASASSRDGMSNGPGLAAIMGNSLGLPQLPAAAGFNVFMQQQQIPQQLLMQGFGGMPGAAHQHMLLQQQAMLAAMQQQQQQQQQGVASAAPSGDANFDVAIEMEVARRIKDRINAAALSRQSLMMQQQQPGMAMANQGQIDQMQSLMQMGAGRSILGGGHPDLQGIAQGFKSLEQQQAQQVFGGAASAQQQQESYGMPSNIQGGKAA